MGSLSENDSPLHSAVRKGQLEEVRKILDEPDVDVNCLNSKHETALHLACDLRHSSIIELLISFGANIFIKDSNNEDLFSRVTNEDCNLINNLLYGQTLWLKGPTLTEKNTPLHDAVRLGQLETVQDILDQKSVGINDKNSANETPLHLACAIGYNGIVRMLMINGASMYVRDSYNNVPIHRAASMGHIDIVDILITVFECDPRIRGYQRRSLLHFACGSGNAKLLDLIVQRNLLDPLIDRDACGFTALHIAALCGHKEIITMLITIFNSPINCINEGAETPLHVACINGHINIVMLLVLEYKAEFTHNFQEDSPLQLAVQFGCIDVVKTLINDFNCNPNEKGIEGQNALQRACCHGHLELVKTLIDDFDLDPMCIDDDMYTPLHYAALNGHLSVVKMLVSQHNVDLNARNDQNDSPLHIAARHGHTNIVKAFITDFNCNRYDKGFEGRTILHLACEYGHIELAEALIIDFGLNPMCFDDNKFTPLHYAVLGGHLSVVKMLVSQHNVNLNARNNQNDSPLHIAARHGHTNIVKAFINDFNCNRHDKGYVGKTVLHVSCQNGHVELAETLITDFGLDPMCVDDSESTPLHYAALGGHLSVVKMLVSQYNVDLNACNNQNNSPLHLAARGGHTNIVNAFINDFICNRYEKGFAGRTLLHISCCYGHIELAEALIIDFGLDPMCIDDYKFTPLHYAALGGHLSAIKMLVSQHNVDLNACNNQNDSPLHIAARCGHTNIVKAFINDFNCSQHDKGYVGKTILHMSCEKGHVELAETLIADFGLDPMCVDDSKSTPLHYAALGGHLSVVRMLVSQHNADLNACNNQNNSPLQLAAFKGHKDVVKVMINELNRKTDGKGLQSQAALTSVSHACRKGNEDLVIMLIADLVCLSPLSTDSDGNTLLHIAAMYEGEQCVHMLLYTYNAPVYLRNGAGKTAREMTKSSGIRAIIDMYLSQILGNIQANYKELQLLSSKKYSGEQRLTRVFVVGNVMSGKSTLIESLKRDGFFDFYFGQVAENTVPLHTSGIIPSIHLSKIIGRVIYYDFAGDPEYYSSHSAIIANVLQSKVGTNLFLIVINLKKDTVEIQEELGYWLCFITYHNKCACKSICTVVIIGSHVDCITNADMNRKLKGMSKFMQAHFSKLSPGPGNFEIYGKTLTLNCRQPRSTQRVRDAIFQISKVVSHL